MSAGEAAIYGGVAGGVVAGVLGIAAVLVGLLAGRYLERVGKLHCEPTVMIFDVMVRMPEVGFLHVTPSDPEAVSASYAEGRFGVKIFNEKDVDIGLRDPYVVFSWRGGEETRSEVYVSGSDRMLKHVEVLDLPSRRWVSISLHTHLNETDAKRLPKEELEEAELRGYFPTGRLFKQTIPQEP